MEVRLAEVALAEFETLGLRRRCDIGGVDHVAGIHGRDPEMPRDVDGERPARH